MPPKSWLTMKRIKVKIAEPKPANDNLNEIFPNEREAFVFDCSGEFSAWDKINCLTGLDFWLLLIDLFLTTPFCGYFAVPLRLPNLSKSKYSF